MAGREHFSWTVTSAAGQSARIDSVETIVPGVWYHVAAVARRGFSAAICQWPIRGGDERQFSAGLWHLPPISGVPDNRVST